jgi:predicted nucleotidyltransferase
MGEPVSALDPIAVFRADLTTLSIKDLVRKHISTGTPRAFSEHEYFELRRVVASEFDLHPSSVVVVGSTRVGFSLNPKHRYRLVEPGSDIDVAIVSPERFDDYWDRVFDFAREDIAWSKSEGKKFRNNLFNGWIDPRYLPNTPSFEPAERWVRFFDGLMQSQKYGRRQITARLYRTWDRLEAYQERSVIACKPTGTTQ